MDFDLDDRRQVIGLVIAAVAVTAVASYGFATVSQNPLRPNAELTASDASEPYHLNRSGTVDMLTIDHTGGEVIRMENVQIIIGSRAEGVRFNQSANWRYNTTKLSFAMRLNGEPLSDGATFVKGDRLTISKVSGTGSSVGVVEPRLQVFHLPSQQVILNERVTVR